MATIPVKTKNSINELVQRAEQLDLVAFKKFFDELILIRGKKLTQNNVFPKKEADLILTIHSIIPLDLLKRSKDLRAKKDTTGLTADEREELLSLVDEIEHLNVKRIKYLVELAKIRKTSLSEVMKQLNIFPNQDDT